MRTPEEIISLLTIITKLAEAKQLPLEIQNELGNNVKIYLSFIEEKLYFIFEHKVDTAIGVLELEKVVSVDDNMLDNY